MKNQYLLPDPTDFMKPTIPLNPFPCDGSKNYLETIHSIHLINLTYQLNDRQSHILDFICKKHLEQVSCWVMDVIHHKEFGSQATIENVLKKLIQRGLVATTVNPKDQRMKTLTPTIEALQRLEQMEDVFAH